MSRSTSTSFRLLAVEVPDDVDLDEWANVEEGAPEGWRRDWCVPADLLCQQRLKTDPLATGEN